jgi:hypothetical protein
VFPLDYKTSSVKSLANQANNVVFWSLLAQNWRQIRVCVRKIKFKIPQKENPEGCCFGVCRNPKIGNARIWKIRTKMAMNLCKSVVGTSLI